ncbi:MAG TPA: hypothetical protein VD978_32200 [Azospirillum sp.]|nr:hypothetical protein [Azospirillum sp.]
MFRSVKFGLPAVILAGLAGCTPNYSPNTYSASAIQQANKVEPAIVVGFRQVEISANGTVGVVTGGAAGGILGAQSESVGINSALGAVGGTAIGSLLGTAIEHMAIDTKGWEYIVRKPDGELLSVTQRQEAPIPVGQKVLVITGSQARIVPDYSVLPDPPPPPVKDKAKADDRAVERDMPPQAPTAAPSPEPAPSDAEAPASPSEPVARVFPAPAAPTPLPGDSNGNPTEPKAPST